MTRLSLSLLDLTLPTIEANLALDEALLIAAEERGAGPILRFWEPRAVTVVLGASSRLRDDVEVERCQAEGVPVARRSSGGGTVVVGPGTLNVAVVLPIDAQPGLIAVDRAQILVLERIAEALRELDANVLVQGSGDLTLHDRKFAGSAQRRLRRHLLVHATLIYAMPLELVTRYTRPPAKQPEYRAGRSHVDFLTTLPLPRSTLTHAIRSAWNADATLATIPEDLTESLLQEKFLAPGWVSRF
ncbi:MAG: biotin/lipoate A/B protein ligase family protein [Isosphaeraceae bacterium]